MGTLLRPPTLMPRRSARCEAIPAFLQDFLPNEPGACPGRPFVSPPWTRSVRVCAGLATTNPPGTIPFVLVPRRRPFHPFRGLPREVPILTAVSFTVALGY